MLCLKLFIHTHSYHLSIMSVCFTLTFQHPTFYINLLLSVYFVVNTLSFFILLTLKWFICPECDFTFDSQLFRKFILTFIRLQATRALYAYLIYREFAVCLYWMMFLLLPDFCIRMLIVCAYLMFRLYFLLLLYI